MQLTANQNDLCKVQFSEDQLNEIFKLQAEANDVMSDAWRTSGNEEIPYYRASWVELSESVMHLGFKWWKKEHKDEAAFLVAKEQAIMEIVDVMHFAASDYVRAQVAIPTNMVYLPNTFGAGNEWINVPLLNVIEGAIAHIIKHRCTSWSWICMIAEALDVTSDKLYGMYVGKNVLNKFRTSHGQREGTYAKIWNGREDNEFLTEFLGQMERSLIAFTADDLEIHLANLYAYYSDLKQTKMA